jgi:histidinol-phosphatase (PHP family)
VQPYSQELLQPWVDQARRIGLTDIALTDHDRYREGVSFDEIERLREKNSDIKIRAGIELDNDPHGSEIGRGWVEKHWDRLDFVLGSVHFLEDDQTMFDTVPDGAGQIDGRDIDAVYADYLRRVREIAASGLVDCLAHLDLIKIHGHRPHGEIRSIFGETLDLISRRGLAIELSTAGWRKPVKEQYPSVEVIGLAKGKGIAFTTASDAHSHVQLGENYRQLGKVMSAAQISEVSIFDRHQRSAVTLP